MSQRLSRDGSTVTRWLQRDRQGGLEELLEAKPAPGTTPKIQGEILKKLVARLECSEGFSSYGQIVEWLEQEFHLQVKYKTVYRLVHYQLKATLKVARPVSKDQDEQARGMFF
ncbi:MAG: helix-turn-helix domain-containing protein [Desmonostoc vinosum HA7617-LM4]|jgi:transposase|nr:helix-turn-helix domain-containing protein [Desmonostoc vinosum HA7617-LM4]